MSKLTDIHEKIEETIKNLVELELLFDNLNTESYTNENKEELYKEYDIKSNGFSGAVIPMRERAEFMLKRFERRADIKSAE